MYEALLNLFNLFNDNIFTPLNDALINSGLIEYISNFISKFLTCFFKLWNNENNFIFSSQDIICLLSECLSVVILCLCLYAFLKIFMLFYRVITKGLSKVC